MLIAFRFKSQQLKEEVGKVVLKFVPRGVTSEEEVVGERSKQGAQEGTGPIHLWKKISAT